MHVVVAIVMKSIYAASTAVHVYVEAFYEQPYQ